MIELLLQAERALSVGLLDRAETLYRQVANADPRNSIAVVGLARVTLDRGDEVGALALSRRALEIDPENDAAIRLTARLEEVLDYRFDAVAALGLDEPAAEGEPEPEPGSHVAPETEVEGHPAPRSEVEPGPEPEHGSVVDREPDAVPEPTRPTTDARTAPTGPAPEPASEPSLEPQPGLSPRIRPESQPEPLPQPEPMPHQLPVRRRSLFDRLLRRR